DGGHLERLDGDLEFVPGLSVMKPLPQIVALGEISQRPVERFLPPADSRLDLAEQRRRGPERASVEQLASFATRAGRRLIPGIPLQPDPLTAFHRHRFAIAWAD